MGATPLIEYQLDLEAVAALTVRGSAGSNARAQGVAAKSGSGAGSGGTSGRSTGVANHRGGANATAGTSGAAVAGRQAVSAVAGTVGAEGRSATGLVTRSSGGNGTEGTSGASTGVKASGDCGSPTATGSALPGGVDHLTGGVTLTGPGATALDTDDGDTTTVRETPNTTPPPPNLITLIAQLIAGLLTPGNGLPPSDRSAQVTFDPIPTPTGGTLTSLSLTVTARIDGAAAVQVVFVTPDGVSGGANTFSNATYAETTVALSTPTITAADLAAGLALDFNRYTAEPSDWLVTRAELRAVFTVSGACLGTHGTAGGSGTSSGIATRRAGVAGTSGVSGRSTGIANKSAGAATTAGANGRATGTANKSGGAAATGGVNGRSFGVAFFAGAAHGTAGTDGAAQGTGNHSSGHAGTAGTSGRSAGVASRQFAANGTTGASGAGQGRSDRSHGTQGTAGSFGYCSGVATHPGPVAGTSGTSGASTGIAHQRPRHAGTAGTSGRSTGVAHRSSPCRGSAGTNGYGRTLHPLCGAIGSELDAATIADRLVTAGVRTTTTAGHATSRQQVATIRANSRAGTITEQ